MSSGQCNKCGSTNLDTDSPGGNVVCIGCGNVLEDSGIVSEVQYIQDSRGASKAVGHLISFEDGMAYGLGHRYGSGKESRANTIRNAREKIQKLASDLQLRPHAVDTALNYYKLALTKQLTKGRKSPHVIAACVYMVCRKDGTSHMLLDLSDVLKINVFELGRTYLKLSSELKINSPAIDPIIYIERFAHQLEFGKKEQDVALTAAKLVRRMKSDWIHFGRRPSGLCGAALLVAARLHNFNRTIHDIIKIVKVCQATVRKRLSEFGETPSAQLSIDVFMNVDLSEEQDPPSFKNARKKLRELDDEERIQNMENQMTEFRKQIEDALEATKRKSMYQNLAEDDDTASVCSLTNSPDDPTTVITDNTAPNHEGDPTAVNRLIAENTADSLRGVIPLDEDSGCSTAVSEGLVPFLTLEAENIHETETVAEDSEDTAYGTEPSMELLGLRTDISQPVKTVEAKGTDQNEELDLTGIDDSELDIYFMKPFEFKKKDEFWHKINADYLEELREKEERKLLEEEENAKKPPKKKRNTRPRGSVQASTTGEAMSKVFQQKKISTKLNYDILKSLNPLEPNLVANDPVEKTETESVVSGKSGRSRTRPKLNVPLNIKKGMSAIMGNSRRRALAALSEEPTASEEPPAKRQAVTVVEKEPEIPVVKIEEPVKQEIEEIEDLEDEDEDEEDYAYSKDHYEAPPEFDEYDDYTEPYDD